jgi:hypothetical protein
MWNTLAFWYIICLISVIYACLRSNRSLLLFASIAMLSCLVTNTIRTTHELFQGYVIALAGMLGMLLLFILERRWSPSANEHER